MPFTEGFDEHKMGAPTRTLCVLGLIVVAARAFNPGDAVQDLRVRTLDDDGFLVGGSVIITAFDPTDAFSSNMFRCQRSLAALLERSPPGVDHLFVSHSGDASANAVWMRRQVLDSAARLHLSSQEIDEVLSRLHFATATARGLDGWLAPLLDEWTTPRNLVKATFSQTQTLGEGHGKVMEGCAIEDMESTRLDAFYSWIPWPATGVTGRLALVGADGSAEGACLNGSVALVPLHGTKLRYGELLDRIQGAGAIAVVFAAPPGRHIFELNCTSPQDCSVPVTIPATMISHSAGRRLRSALQAGCQATVQLLSRPGPGLHAALDASGRLEEVGWLKFPSLLHAVWAAQWQVYKRELHRKLPQEPDAVVVSILDRVNMTGEHGASVNVTLQSLWVATKGTKDDRPPTRLELDMELGCPGTRDEDCPVWDHAVQLFACCDDPNGALPPCPACPTTLWAQPQQRKSRAAAAVCGWELGRWMTPFRRRVGRWVTDASHLLPLLQLQPGQERRCSFTMQSTPWAGVWQPSLRLRFSPGPQAPPAQPHQQPPALEHNKAGRPSATTLLPLPFSGGTFDAQYNSRFPPFSFATPPDLRRAVVVALVSGHGSDDYGCAEFCPTSHHLEINGQEHVLEFSHAGTLWGCADRVAEGVTPNEHGTWQYGRGGWCNGKDVAPWVADITADLLPPSGKQRWDHADGGADNNTLRYFGLFQGKPPAPLFNPGYIMMSASLVLYTSPPPAAADH